MFQKLFELYDNKTLSDLVKWGFITTQCYDYVVIYIWIDDLIKDDPAIGITEAVTRATVVFSRPPVYVWRAVRLVSGDNYKKYKKSKSLSHIR